MNRQDKEQLVSELRESFQGSSSLFLVGYKGLTVEQMQALRRGVRQEGGHVQVAKWRLMKRAAEGVEAGVLLDPYFKGQIAVVFADKETAAVAKTLSDFSKENGVLSLIAGTLDGQLLDANNIVRIAHLPSKEVLLSQVCGTLQAPTTSLVRVLNMVMLKLLWTLKAVAKKKK